MEWVTKVLYWLSTGLFIPLMIALLFFLIRSLLMTGEIYSLFVHRTKFRKSFNVFLNDLKHGKTIVSIEENLPLKTTFAKYLSELISSQYAIVVAEKLIADFELYCVKEVGKAKTLAKMGPILGLMGTLIPMGPALVGLARGDISSLAENMQVAFATTVVGLFIGSIGFLLGQAKQRWYAEDLNDLQYINEMIKQQKNVKKEI